VISFPESMCPLCSRFVAREELYGQIALEDPRVRHRTIKVIQAYHPGWVEGQGACGPCWRSYRDAVRIFLVMDSTRRQSGVGRSKLAAFAGGRLVVHTGAADARPPSVSIRGGRKADA
jgi:hypothetical protein